MTKPKLTLDIVPSLNGQVYYLPLAPRSLDHEERLKIAVRLKITHDDPEHDSLTITAITFSFPGTALDPWPMKREQQSMNPAGGVLAFGETATWSNGSVVDDNGDKLYNQVYLDTPVPPQLTVNVYCEGFSEAWSQTFDLIPWVDSTGDGPLRLPFARHELAEEEYIVTSARHWYNGGTNGTQIFAHDIMIQARVGADWTNSYTGEATQNEDTRVFGRPVRAMADGEVIAIETGFADNPYGEELTDTTYGSNHVWVRYGDLEVKCSHLRADSIIVQTGQAVQSGQKLAEAGNSGNTGGSPHLHMECRLASDNTLCGFTFKKAWMLDRSLVPATGDGPRVQLDGHGICEEKAALRPFPTKRFRPKKKPLDPELDSLVGEVFGGVSQDGGGFVIVGGKIIKIPPRGLRWELLKSIVDLDDADELKSAEARKLRKDAVHSIEAALQNFDNSP